MAKCTSLVSRTVRSIGGDFPPPTAAIDRGRPSYDIPPRRSLELWTSFASPWFAHGRLEAPNAIVNVGGGHK